MNKARFMTIVAIGDTPSATPLEVVEIKDDEGNVVDLRYGIPNSIILLTEREVRAKNDLFIEVPKASFGNLCGLMETADKENHIYIGDEFVYYSIVGKEWIRDTFDGASSEQIAMLAVGLAVSFPTNAKQLMNRLERISKAFNLGLTSSEVIVIAGEADIVDKVNE